MYPDSLACHMQKEICYCWGSLHFVLKQMATQMTVISLLTITSCNIWLRQRTLKALYECLVMWLHFEVLSRWGPMHLGCVSLLTYRVNPSNISTFVSVPFTMHAWPGLLVMCMWLIYAIVYIRSYKNTAICDSISCKENLVFLSNKARCQYAAWLTEYTVVHQGFIRNFEADVMFHQEVTWTSYDL